MNKLTVPILAGIMLSYQGSVLADADMFRGMADEDYQYYEVDGYNIQPETLDVRVCEPGTYRCHTGHKIGYTRFDAYSDWVPYEDDDEGYRR